MFAENQVQYEAQMDNWQDEQDILAGLAEINYTAELFGMTFEEASEFCVKLAEQKLKEAQTALRQLKSAVPTK
jgi:hypothetical protein